MSNRIVGVSIEARVIRAVEVRFWRGQARAVRAAAVELPDGALDWGTIVDRKALGDALRRLWDEAGFKSRRVALAIDGHHVLTRHIELPVLSEASYREALRYDLAELLSYDPDEAVIDDIELSSRTGDTGVRHRVAIAVAVRGQTLVALREVMQEAGLGVVRFDLGSLALDRAVADDTDRAELLIHVGVETTTATVRTADGVQFLRSVAVGTGDGASALASELEAQLQTVMAHDRTTSSVGAPGSSYGHYRHPVSEAVRGTLEYLATTSPGLTPTVVLLSGSESFEHLSAIVGTGTDLPILPARTDASWTVAGAEASDYLLEIGTALAASGEARTILDLRTERERIRDTGRHRSRLGVGLAVLTALAATAQVVDQRMDLADARRVAGRAEASLAVSDGAIAERHDLAALQTDYDRAVTLLDRALVDDVDLVGVIDTTVTGLPGDAVLSTLSIRSGAAETTVPFDEGMASPVASIDIQVRTAGHTHTADWLRAFERVEHLYGEQISGSLQNAADEGGTALAVSARAAVAGSARWNRSGLYGGGPLGDTRSSGSGMGS